MSCRVVRLGRLLNGRTLACSGMVVGLVALAAAVVASPAAGAQARAAVLLYGPSAAAPGAGLAAAHAPVVSSVSPSAGPLSGGGTVTVLGSGFTSVKAVKFGAAAGTRVKVVSSGKLTVIAPAHAAGTVDVRVTAAAGTSAVSAHDRYAYDAAAVSLVSPAAGPEAAGTVVTVHGTGFTAVKSVLFGPAVGTGVKVVSATELTVTSPAHAAGTVDVRVTTAGGTSPVAGGDKFSYDAVPAITSVTPSTGSTAGGTTVTISGSGFTAVKSVRFGSAAGSGVKVVSAGDLTVTTAAGTAGTVDVRVTTAGGTSPVSTADRYTFVSPVGPVTGLKATTVTATGLTLSWSNPSSPGFTGVTIRRAQGAVPPPSTTAGTLVATTAAADTSYADAGLTPATQYSYSLFAHDAAGYSAAATITVTTGPAPIADVSGALTENTTWSPQGASAYVLDGDVDVPAGITLTLEPGTVVKSASGDQITVEGSMDAAGTAASPVVFTSVNDNSAGGATGSGSPAAGDWGGIEVSGAGALDIGHAHIEYPATGVQGTTTGQVRLTDDVLSSLSAGGVFVSAGTVTVEGNDVVGSGSEPDWVSSPSLDFGLLGGNSATGGIPGFYLTGTVLASSTWAPEPARG